jgi:hypothetical protein
MALSSIAEQPITTRRLVDYVRPTGSGADQASLRSLLAAAGFPAGEGARALTEQVRRFQQSQITGGQALVHGADGRAGPETLAALRRVVGQNLAQAEVPSGLADPQADAFVAGPGRGARAPQQAALATPPPPGQARVGGDEAASRRAAEEALRQREAGAREPMTPGEEQVENLRAMALRAPPTTGEQLREASADRARLGQIRRELQAMGTESAARPDPTWTQRATRLQREEEALTSRLAANPQAARLDQLEQASRQLSEAERLSRGWAGFGRSRPEAERRVEDARTRFNGLASELGFLP